MKLPKKLNKIKKVKWGYVFKVFITIITVGSVLIGLALPFLSS